VAQKFLIIQTAFIGDVVLATGLVEKLHRHFPGAEIDFLLRKGNEGLLAGHPYIHRVLVWDKKRKKNKNFLSVLKQVRGMQYDKVINLQRYFTTGLLLVLSKGKEKTGFDKNPWSRFFDRKVKHALDGRHEYERNHDLIRSFTDEKPALPVLYPSETDYAKVKSYKSGPFLCIAPASVQFTKQFPASKWISFMDKLPAGIRVFLIGAPGDEALARTILQGSRHENTENLCGRLSFLESAALMRDAVMNYVNDSAPLHFASAMNAPVTAVFCSTIPAFGFGPLSKKSFIIENKTPLSCRPCSLHGEPGCPEGHFKCAMDIDASQLLTVLLKAQNSF